MAVIKGPDGQVANVTDAGQLVVSATTQGLAEALNLAGLIFDIHGTVTPAGANDYFFYLKNVGSNDLGVSIISLSVSAPTEIRMNVVSGTPVYTSEVPSQIINLNLGSSSVLPAEASHDVNITGLTDEGLLVFEECAIADTRYERVIASSVVVPQGKAIALQRVSASGTVKFSVGVGIIPS